jgi:hypothetical protein
MFNVSVSAQVPRIAVIASAPTIIGLTAITDSRIGFGMREGTTTEGGYFHEEREFFGDMFITVKSRSPEHFTIAVDCGGVKCQVTK